MTTRITWTRLATASVCFLLQACSGGSAQTDAGLGQESGSDPSRTYAPTMTAIYGEILSGRCAIPFCHLGVAGSPPLFTDPGSSYAALVNAHASGTKCGDAGTGQPAPAMPEPAVEDGGEGGAGGDAGAEEAAASGWILVVPGDPDASLLYRKIERPTPPGLCGDPMPGGGEQPLDDRDIQQIRTWIAQGAKNN
jgi:hypothetical protein